MLVLSRKNGERVRIGQSIQVTVLECHNGRVKLGFSAPPEIPIHREELASRVATDIQPSGDRAIAGFLAE
jgi:carbon storage regulator